tara:strand:+ start:100 stop:597 length:498 start_codon:yes stop_codon:yes gene_type:complete
VNLRISDKEQMMGVEHAGGCLCGGVRFKVEGEPTIAGVCHCRYCQLRTGSAFAVLAYFEPDKFKLTSGEPKHYHFTSESGKDWDIKFCPKCGGTSFYQLETWGELIGIDAGAFDPPGFWFPIKGEAFTKGKANFVGHIDADRHYETFPGYNPVSEDEQRMATRVE